MQDGTTYVLYRGFLDDFTVEPNRDDRSVAFTCLDAISMLQSANMSTALYQGIRTGTAVGVILDQIGWPSGARDLDPGATIIRWWWEDGTDGLAALTKLASAEGPPAIFYVDGSGNFVYRDRHHRLTRSASTSSQCTFTNGTSAESASVVTYSQPASYDAGWKDIVNTVTAACGQRDPSTRAMVWSSTGNKTLQLDEGGNVTAAVMSISETIAIPSGGNVTFTVQASDPFIGAVTPVAGVHFNQQTGTTTASLSRTTGQSTTITYTDSGGGSIISGMWLEAIPVTVTGTTQISQQDSASAAAYGTRGSGTDLGWCSVQDAAAVISLLLARYAQRRPTITIPVYNLKPARLTQMLSRDLSDRVTLTDTILGFSAGCFIEKISYSVSEGGKVMQAQFACEKAPTDSISSPTAPFTFNAATNGKFNTGKFGT